jgi:hypothetical protein
MFKTFIEEKNNKSNNKIINYPRKSLTMLNKYLKLHKVSNTLSLKAKNFFYHQETVLS